MSHCSQKKDQVKHPTRLRAADSRTRQIRPKKHRRVCLSFQAPCVHVSLCAGTRKLYPETSCSHARKLKHSRLCR